MNAFSRCSRPSSRAIWWREAAWASLSSRRPSRASGEPSISNVQALEEPVSASRGQRGRRWKLMLEPDDVRILLIEDDLIDFEALVRAFKKHQVNNPVFRARDGLEALEILRGKGRDPPLPRPYLIILDLNLPTMSGIEFL